jgi:HAD superfamily hydrolase (TIGR01509 family)
MLVRVQSHSPQRITMRQDLNVITTNSVSRAPVHAVVFDMDGVLIDSEPIWDEVRRAIASAAGRPWPTDATHLMQGMSTSEWSTYLVSTVGVPGPPSSVAETVIDLMAARYDSALPLLPGAVAAVARLAAVWPLGLASSSPRRLIDSVLTAAGLTSSFMVTVSTEEVAAGKPAPDVYLAVVSRLGDLAGRAVEPGRTVAIEDSSNGLRSAAAAGLVVVAAPQASYPPAADALAQAPVVVTGLDELTTDLIGGL